MTHLLAPPAAPLGNSLGIEVLDEWRHWYPQVRVPWPRPRGPVKLEALRALCKEQRPPSPALITVIRDVVPVSVSRDFAAGRANVTLREFDSDHQLLDVVDEMFAASREFLGL
ncbi:MAG: hypothetical protein HS123_16115 [Solibacteraceae bacterium]|nr:hypothetical protein [Solibacteraceae bacterium]